MEPFAPDHYGSAAAALLSDEAADSLGPGKPDPAREEALASLTRTQLFEGRAIVDNDMAACCQSALWLRHDFLDQSHAISQSVHTATGSFWHGIMHRREPDFGNSAYWFRRVGEHAIFDALAEEARAIASAEPCDPAARFLTGRGEWNPFAFIDLCSGAINSHTPTEELCRHVQRREWELLFDYCYSKAVGG